MVGFNLERLPEKLKWWHRLLCMMTKEIQDFYCGLSTKWVSPHLLFFVWTGKFNVEYVNQVLKWLILTFSVRTQYFLAVYFAYLYFINKVITITNNMKKKEWNREIKLWVRWGFGNYPAVRLHWNNSHANDTIIQSTMQKLMEWTTMEMVCICS